MYPNQYKYYEHLKLCSQMMTENMYVGTITFKLVFYI